MRAFDRMKIILALVLFAAVLLVPALVLLYFVSQDDLATGLLAAGGTLALLLLLAFLLIVTIRKQTWFSSSLPIILGALYSLIPDAIIGPVDDGAALTGGALISFVLWLRKQPNLPKWVVLPGLAAAVYTWLGGGFLPGPIDELIVYAISAGMTLSGLRRQPLPAEPTTRPNDDFIEGEYVDLDKERR